MTTRLQIEVWQPGTNTKQKIVQLQFKGMDEYRLYKVLEKQEEEVDERLQREYKLYDAVSYH